MSCSRPPSNHRAMLGVRYLAWERHGTLVQLQERRRSTRRGNTTDELQTVPARANRSGSLGGARRSKVDSANKIHVLTLNQVSHLCPSDDISHPFVSSSDSASSKYSGNSIMGESVIHRYNDESDCVSSSPSLVTDDESSCSDSDDRGKDIEHNERVNARLQRLNSSVSRCVHISHTQLFRT